MVVVLFDICVQHLPLRIRLERSESDDTSQHGSGLDRDWFGGAAALRVFSYKDFEQAQKKRPMIEVLFKMPEAVKDSKTQLQIELRHDDWKFFDISGHLWDIEIRHGKALHKLVSWVILCFGSDSFLQLWIPRTTEDGSAVPVPLLKFKFSTRMDRIAGNFKWLRRCL